MRIKDWNNLKNLGFKKFGSSKYRRKNNTYYVKVCGECGERYLGQKKSNYCCKRCANLGQNNNMFNKHHTEESKSKMSESRINRVVSESTKEKLRIINTGKLIPESQRKRISKTLKSYYSNHKGTFLW